MNLQLRAIETANLELRVEKLEKLLAQLAAGRDKIRRHATDEPMGGGESDLGWVNY